MDNNERSLLGDDFLSFIMSEGDLKSLGMGDVAYIRRHNIKGREVFILHAADGEALDVGEHEEETFKIADTYELNLVSLH